jgi:deoxyadenosine/deoxycytidine kinase
MILIVIAGNIGAGKSTLCEALAKAHNLFYLPEPVQAWIHSNALADFYKTGNAFAFQTLVLQSRAEAFDNVVQQQTPNIIVADRWLEEDFDIATANYHLGKMTIAEYEKYQDTFKELQNKYKDIKIYRIWLDVQPETCLQRIHQRGRPEEQTITLEYLQCLQQHCTTSYDIVLPNTNVQDTMQHIMTLPIMCNECV